MTRLIQPSFAAGEIGPALYGRVDVSKYAVALRTAKNVFVRPHGGVANRTGLRYVGPARAHNAAPRLIPFRFSTTQTYVLEFTDLRMRVIKDGGHVLEASKVITGATQASPVVVTSTAHGFSNGDEVYIAGVVGMTRLNGRRFKVANVTANTFELTHQVTGANVDGTGFAVYVSGGTVARVYTLTTPYAQADLATLKFVQSADVMTLVHPSYDPRELSRTGHAAWSIATITFAPSIATPTGWSGSGTAGSETYKYRITAVKSETFEESLAQDVTVASVAALSSTNKITLTTGAPTTGAVKYSVYRQKNSGLYGFIGSTEGTTFVDDNVAPDTEQTPPSARNPFSATGDKPGAATYYEQRRVFGGSNNKPDTSYYSQTGNTANMSVSDPSRDDDAITATLTAREVNQIRHFVPLNDLIVMTSGSEWRVSAGSDSGFSAATLRQRPQSYWGSSHMPPIVVGNTVLFVQDRGNIVRSLAYAFESDAYDGADLTILAPHLFENKTLVEWAYAQIPHSIIWCVLSDGTALSLTWNKEQQVVAWCRHETDGFFESVASIPETGDNEDAVYFVVRRTIDGQTVRNVERLDKRLVTAVEDGFFVDCGATYSGAAATTITGLDHLEGRAVSVLSDGNVVAGLTVSGGAITLPRAATKVHVGLAYVSDVETLNIELSTRSMPTAQGIQKKVTSVVVRFLRSRGLFIGPDFDNLSEMKWRENEDYGEATQLLTGDKKQHLSPQWNSNGRVAIRQSYPLPMEIQAVIPDVEFGG
jgi:hypothetical protein